MVRTVRLEVVRNDRKRQAAKRFRTKFFKEARSAIHAVEEPAGFAFVVWDQKGSCATEMYPGERPPIGMSMLPDYCKDALNRYLASMLVDSDPDPKDRK